MPYADEHDICQAVLWPRIRRRMERDSLKIIYLLWVCRHLQCSKMGDNMAGSCRVPNIDTNATFVKIIDSHVLRV